MSDFIEDVVDSVIKPKNSKLFIKWLIRGSIVLITFAFIFGQIKIAHLNRLNSIEKSVNENIKATNELRKEIKSSINEVNSSIDKIYEDGSKIFENYQKHNKKQLELIIDYGSTNKELLKKVLEINESENIGFVEKQIIDAKSKINKNLSITIHHIDKDTVK